VQGTTSTHTLPELEYYVMHWEVNQTICNGITARKWWPL